MLCFYFYYRRACQVLFAEKVKDPAQAELGRGTLQSRLDAMGRATRRLLGDERPSGPDVFPTSRASSRCRDAAYFDDLCSVEWYTTVLSLYPNDLFTPRHDYLGEL